MYLRNMITMSELYTLTLQQTIEGLKKKDFTSKEITDACLERIEKTDDSIKSFITVIKDRAVSQAEKADVLISNDPSIWDTKPFLGVPFSIKDLFNTAGILTTASSNILRDYIPVYDATVYKRLIDAGAILLGKTNTDSFAHGSSTETSDFFTTSNPWDTKKLPGGSSGGSAASVIADQSIFSIGSETAGSIRQPGSWCGIVGLKPTYGRASRYGVVAMSSSLDCPGPMTKTVWDAAKVLEIIGGKDEYDATTSLLPVPVYTEKLPQKLDGLKIGISSKYFDGVQKEIVQALQNGLKILEKQGARVIDVELFDPKYAISVYTIQQRSEVSSNLARYDGVRFGNKRDNFNKENRNRIMFGTYSLSAGYYDAYYKKAAKVRSLFVEDFKKVFKDVDVIIGPTTPTTALPKGASELSDMFGELQDILVEPSTISGLPGINIPCGFDKEHMPIGMQIFAPQFEEKKIIDVAYVFEQATDFHLQKPNL